MAINARASAGTKLIVRGARALRVGSTEAAIRGLGGQVSLVPHVNPRGGLNLGLRARF